MRIIANKHKPLEKSEALETDVLESALFYVQGVRYIARSQGWRCELSAPVAQLDRVQASNTYTHAKIGHLSFNS